ncbi:MAG: hypothetical protein HRF50_00645 [Phycisphaerae bacterium]|jgi:hypothetical protein
MNGNANLLTRLAISGALTLSAAFNTAAGEIPTYAVEYLGYAGSTLSMGDMNNHGVCVGETYVGSQRRPWLARPGSAVGLLPVPDGFAQASAVGVNDAGVVVGNAFPASGVSQSVRWTPTPEGYIVEVLAPLPGHVGSVAAGINNLGDVVGRSLASAQDFGTPVAFAADGATINLGAAGFPVAPVAINDLRQVCGEHYRMDLDTLLLEDLGFPPPQPGGYSYTFVRASAINNLGQVVAVGALSSSQGYAKIIRYTDDVGWQELDNFPSALNSAYDINDDGTVLMNIPYNSARRLVAYQDGLGLFALEYQLDAPSYYWLPTYYGRARIANSGLVMALVDNINNSDPRYGVGLLTPVGATVLPGDVNGDGYVRLDDVCTWQSAPFDLDGDGVVDADDERYLTDALAAYGFIVSDCNSNESADFCDIAGGLSLDRDLNGEPDECQADCSGDGVPDAAEPDCNGNGTSDVCDIADGASADCNANGVPDECDGASVTTYSFDYPVSNAPIFPNTILARSGFVAAAGVVADLDVLLHDDYRVGDVAVRLSHLGTTVTLVDRPGYPSQYGSGFSELGYNIRLDDEGTGGLIENRGHHGGVFDPILSPPSYRPNNPLRAFDGMPIGGVWTIEIETFNSSPIAMLYSWGLAVSKAEVPATSCPIPGDLDGDGEVDLADLSRLLSAFGTCVGDAAFDSGADLDADGCIGLADLSVLLTNFGL